MTTKENIEQLKSLIEHFNNGGNDFNATDIEAIKFLLKENQQLKQKYENAVADYEKTEFEKEQLNSLVNSCQEKIRQLKKQLEDKYEKVGTLTGELLYEENTKLINQQKEFVKYLEDESKEVYRDGGLRQNIFRQILQKYKEIIGDINDKK